MISTLAQTLDLSFNRIQFTPDLIPADVTGTEIIEEDRSTGRRDFRFMKGLCLPMWCLQTKSTEHQKPKRRCSTPAGTSATVDATGMSCRIHSYACHPEPNRAGGTYPLPEAQQDRFMFKVYVEYPSFDEEFEVARRTTGTAVGEVAPVLGAEEILRLQRLVRQVPVSDHVVRYALSLVRQTRVGSDGIPDFVEDLVGWGAGPRAVQFLILGGKARALLQGRFHVQVEDIQALAKPVLRHRRSTLLPRVKVSPVIMW